MSDHGTLAGHVITREEAKRLIADGGQAFAVYEGRRPTLYSDEEAAWVHAERIDGIVLDWETGEYA